ncbi:alpha-hydroxy acid oxidase [Micromonospora sp. RL09-050-HVF-A]|uniref:alpha-hydroxy acid oxidase n=1 Tax=Micromonospora sp. RL09-050-HVF-A TaxID=1703433 RepID=UPI001C5E6AE0|nr:alpha-hydroxy acid oxidase [Micromonospora sp. RL09-050-HVF-A]MBW4701785.1 alpha-hydroxy-acid oxidizing protein [Micromonospora sp. RL09-050-HVF-A]
MPAADEVGLNLADVADAARRRLDPVHWDFFAGGADDERTLRANEAAFGRRWLRPRVLRGAGERDLRISLFGSALSMPVLVAPTAFHRLAHPEGEVATARAAAEAGTVMVVSMAATRPVEQIAAAGGPLWFQLYPHTDLEFTTTVVRRAVAAGCRALVVTVDSPVFGRRERDLRHGFVDLPAGMVCENMRDANGRVRDIEMNARVGWELVAVLRRLTTVPILLKGVLHPEDARLAVEHGVDGVLVSNHGGRQLDGVTATLDALPAVVAAVDGRLPVLVDGGLRRGTDVLVALALGATAVLVGRPVLWGLAVAGAAGVRHVLDLLRADLDRALALVGVARPGDLSADLVTTGASA